MIKKIEHFWKGLSKDRTQISALPPEQYGDRFFNFIEGITLSPEQADRDAERREQEAVRAQASIDRSSTRTQRHKPNYTIPPMPDYQPPATPAGPQSPEGRETVQMARRELRRTEMGGNMGELVPDRTLKATSATSEGRNSMQHESILPVVEEDLEHSLTRDRSRTAPVASGKSLPPVPNEPPPPPPPTHSSSVPLPNSPHPHPKLDGSDSGYGENSNGALSRDNSVKVMPRMSLESLNKTLPPLPKEEEMQDSGIRMVM